MNSLQLPNARNKGLVIQETGDEVLVYDLDTHKAHCLNQTAAYIWKACDGKTSVSEITRMYSKNVNNTVPEDMIWPAIDQLGEKNLLEKELESNYRGLSRREVIKKIGLGTVIALPIVASLTSPTSALAATSCRCPGGDGDCFGQTGCPSTTTCTGGMCQTMIPNEHSDTAPSGGSITIKR